MPETYYSIGVDYHKHFSQVHVLTPNGDDHWKGRINHTEMGKFKALISTIGQPCKLAFEATSNYHLLTDLLQDTPHLIAVLLVNPHKMKIISESHNKNDKVDAKIIAELLRIGYIPCSHIFSKEARELKVLNTHRAKLVKNHTALINTMHCLLQGAGIIASEHVKCGTGSIFAKSRRGHWLSQITDPYYKFNLRSSINVITLLEKEILAINKLITKTAKKNRDTELLLSIPGIGDVFAPIICSEIDGIKRFANKSSFNAYCGLAPTNSSSASKCYQGRIVTKCNIKLRSALIEAAWAATRTRSDPYFARIFERKRAENMTSNKAITVVAKRMGTIIWEMLVEGRPYRRT